MPLGAAAVFVRNENTYLLGIIIMFVTAPFKCRLVFY